MCELCVTSKDELLIPTSAAEVFHRFHKGERLRYGIIAEEGAETSSTKEVTDPQDRVMLLRRHRGQILLGVLLALVLLLVLVYWYWKEDRMALWEVVAPHMINDWLSFYS